MQEAKQSLSFDGQWSAARKEGIKYIILCRRRRMGVDNEIKIRISGMGWSSRSRAVEMGMGLWDRVGSVRRVREENGPRAPKIHSSQ